MYWTKTGLTQQDWKATIDKYNNKLIIFRREVIQVVGCMKNYKVSIVVEKDKNGYYAYCPELQGCYSQGATYEEVIENMRDAIKLHIEDRISEGEDIRQTEMTSIANIEVAV